MANLSESLVEFGADLSALRLFSEDDPDLLPYATLLTARLNNDALEIVSGVYEWQDSPLIFLIDADSLESDDQLHRIRRLLAMRGDAPYLGVVAPGRLEVYRIALDNDSPQQSQVKLDIPEGSNHILLAQLGNKRPRAAIQKPGWISNIVLNLLTGSISRLIELGNITDEDAISLVGRALFTRFLADRNLLPDSKSDVYITASLFDNRISAEEMSAWLDRTFNGDLLPLSHQIFQRLPDEAFKILGDILHKAPNSQLFLGWQEKWDYLDFAHIPVGILSQAYELYLRNHAPDKQRKEGGFYTPRPIADLMVRACFRALDREKKGHLAKVLDPAAGAGVFLLTAFRELVTERWKYDGIRPSTQILRSILYDQIVGFDINEAALRFAALGLYLMSIELDPEPKPVDKLRFENIRGKVLLRITADYPETGFNLGSIGPLIGSEHNQKYDIVIGNPPWSSGTKLQDWKLVLDTVARIAKSRGISNLLPPIPNEVLDLPFVWRAMEWAKTNGQIAFALHARLLFQQGDGMIEARQALFDALDITSVINGVELRQTKVWPEISAPFCIIVASNRPSGVGSGFRLINPRLEESLNNAGCMRIDALNADIIPTQQLAETPDIMKIMFRGSKADLGLLMRIRSHGHPTLTSFWQEVIGISEKGRLRGSGNGYQTLKPSSRTRKTGDGLPGADARYLKGKPELSASSFTRIYIDTLQLDLFTFDRIHDPRSLDIFTGPLTIVHKSPPAGEGRINVAIADHDLVFNETFYGYSPIGHPHANEITRYIALILGSKIALWLVLITSGEFGFEREVVEKATLDRIPFPDFRRLSNEQRNYITVLFDKLRSGNASWETVDTWVASIYGLGTTDIQTIYDTLEYNLPFSENKRKSQIAPSQKDMQQFCEQLNKELNPWANRFNSPLHIEILSINTQCPWYGIAIQTSVQPQTTIIHEWTGLISAADEAAASEILVRMSESKLLIGRLAQRRYWNNTQARLLAQQIVWSHLDLLKRRVTA